MCANINAKWLNNTTESVLIQFICLANSFLADMGLNKLQPTPVGFYLVLQMYEGLDKWGFTGGSDMPGVPGPAKCRC